MQYMDKELNVQTVGRNNRGRRFLIAAVILLLAAGVNAQTNETIVTRAQNLGEMASSALSDHMPDIAAGAAWDATKLLLVWGWHGLLALGGALCLIPALFSQRVRTVWFRRGFGVFKFFAADTFGELVNVKRARKSYRRIQSTSRNEVVKGINGDGGVFLVMGPAGAGKGLMIRAESSARYVLRLDSGQWYNGVGNEPVTPLLKSRTALLVKWLFAKKQPICILLEWNLAHVLPSQDRLEKILFDLMSFLVSSRRYARISFVVKVPAYYLIENKSISVGDQKYRPAIYSVNLLNCSECGALLRAQINYLGETGGQDMSACLKRLEKKAKNHGVALERMIWVESFGRPQQVLEIIGREQYQSLEAWEKLTAWWRSVYAPEGTKDDWLAYLYVIGLKGLLSDDSVNLERIFKGSGLDFKNDIRPAIMHVSTERKFDITRFDPRFIFVDDFVRDEYLYSLGCMEQRPIDGGQQETVFNFLNALRLAFGNANAINLEDDKLCDKLAEIYYRLASRDFNLASRLKSQYAFANRLKAAFGENALLKSYNERIHDINRFDGFVAEVISRMGALSQPHTIEMFDEINKTLRENCSDNEYVKATYALLPAYVISEYLSHAWGGDFEVVFRNIGADDDENETALCATILTALAMMCRPPAVLNGISGDAKLFYERLEAFFANNEHFLKRTDQGDAVVSMLIRQVKTKKSFVVDPNVDYCELDSIRKRAILAMFAIMARHDFFASDFAEYNTDVCDVDNALRDIQVHGTDDMLKWYCLNKLVFYFDLSTEAGVSAWRADVSALLQNIGRWSECPNLACDSFRVLCKNYISAIGQGHGELFNEGELWQLLTFLHEWVIGMCEYSCAYALAHFAELLQVMSSADDCSYDLSIIWKEFSGIVVPFWKARMESGNLEDAAVGDAYFMLVSCVSNIKSIPLESRGKMLCEIPLFYALFWDQLGYNSSAQWVSAADPSLYPPESKFLIVAQILASKAVDLRDDNRQEKIRLAEELIAGVEKDGVRKFDQNLVESLRAACKGRGETKKQTEPL